MLNFYRFKQDYLIFRGSDRLDLINRLSTNQVNTLQQNNGIKTVLTNDKGRFVDLITLYNFGDFVFSSCSFNNSKKVLEHLDKYTIMDDFKPEDLSETHETILFFGENANEFSKDILNVDLHNLSNNDFQFHNIDSHDSIVSRNDNKFGGFLFIYSIKDKQLWAEKILNEDLKKKYNMHEKSDEDYERNRIVLGVPAYGKEMTEQTNPLECGLNIYVSFTKGCYIGQEVIARLDTYDKVSKHLIKVEAEEEFKPEAAKITTDGKECGFITSAIRINNNQYKGLGFIKTIFLDSNKTYKINQNGSLINCRITSDANAI